MTVVRTIVAGVIVAGIVGSAPVRAVAVPFKGNGAGTIVGQEVLGPTHVHLSALGEGDATHLGRYIRTEELDLNPATGAFTGTVVFTAANGDELTCAVAGQFVSATDAVGDYVVTGGTGRFAGAPGNASFSATMTGAATYGFAFNGTIDW